ncbi:LLM class F420-dependent oxidoreductase [Actinoplanes philippinensis]|uniref:Probable F420-dependent oxidoreductase, Rv1855c family n=1 Tax=Actinoplanes philippinensis TaxID=35752 RepID=A0A1I2H2E9_9ACTN|nr:LLM class F420-dependent oxidoreductase [Actinoplanes philippinensis]GIE78298.1 LLM class F420-dependent oxidoreductase [Actinoplanes philippinensis]SFF23449.1 probable F420-dependent oxidoreductase, Rv1855c family [Actinoplanes philippinensis]
MSIGFGVFVPQGWRMDLVEIADPVEQYEAMTAVAKVADAGPWDSIWVYDHFHTVPEPTINTTFEAWTVSSTLARDTSRVNIGQMVGCNGYRHPALYAKIASTVDVASHGRLYAGLGAGWYEHEWKAYGYEWAEVPERMAAFREAVEIVHRMWTEERPVFTGKHYRIDQPINEPKGVRKPHPSFWLGGGGEKVTLKLVAKYADGANFGNGDPEIVKQKTAVLREHCDRLERDYDRIRKSTSYHIDLAHSSAQHIAKIEQLAAAGADYVIAYFPRVAYDHEPLLRFAEEVVPQFS